MHLILCTILYKIFNLVCADGIRSSLAVNQFYFYQQSHNTNITLRFYTIPMQLVDDTRKKRVILWRKREKEKRQ